MPNPCAPTTELVHDRLLYDWAINALHNPLGNSTTHLILYRQLVHVLVPNPEVRLNPHEHLWLNMIVLRISVVVAELEIMSSAPGGSRGWMDRIWTAPSSTPVKLVRSARVGTVKQVSERDSLGRTWRNKGRDSLMHSLAGAKAVQLGWTLEYVLAVV